MGTFLTDLRYGLRGLAQRPGFTVAAVLALGLGIGANTAVFSLVDAVLLAPLPYRAPERLVTLYEADAAQGLPRERLSPVNFLDYKGLSQVFADAAAWWVPEMNLADDRGDPVRAKAVETTANLFSVLGVSPQIGAGFSPVLTREEGQVVMSDRLWRARYGGDPRLVGRAIRLNGAPYTVVGIMPPGFQFPGETDLWQGLAWDLSQHTRHAHFMGSVARLLPGVTIERANAELARLSGRLAAEFPDSNKDWGARAYSLHDEVVGETGPALVVLFAAVGLLLLLACANVANLLLARASARGREVAVRAALGASRVRLLRQFLTESLTLATLAAALGVALAWGVVRLAAAAPGLDLPAFAASQLGVDGRVLAFSAGVTLLTVLLFGLAPSLQMSFADLQAALQRGARGAAGGAGRRTRGTLVVVEVAVAAALAVGSGLLVRSFLRLLAEEPGFTPRGVVTANVELPPSLYGEWHDVARFYAELNEGLASRPGVLRAAATGFLPLAPGWRIQAAVPERPVPADQEPEVQHVTVTPGYFETLGIPLLAGRTFDRRDTDRSAPAVVVSRELARRFWPDEDPVGRTLVSRARRIGPLAASLFEKETWRVVGVVGDVKNAGLAAAEPVVYFAVAQFPCRSMNVVLRGDRPAALAAALRAEVKRRDPGLALDEVRPLSGLLAQATARPRFLAGLMSGFAALALVLAAVGIYGVLSYAVGQRRGEIGVRMALGAAPGDVRRLVLGEGLLLAGCGFVLGAAASAGLARLMASLLFGVKASDGPAFLAALGAVGLTALAACYLPARKAAEVAPVEALRAE